MKSLKVLVTSAVISSVAFAVTAQAGAMSELELYNTIHPESADIFAVGDSKQTNSTEIFSLHDDGNADSMWSYEFEEYVNPKDFQKHEMASVNDINRYMGSHPAAAGSSGRQIFFYNETAGEYHL